MGRSKGLEVFFGGRGLRLNCVRLGSRTSCQEGRKCRRAQFCKGCQGLPRSGGFGPCQRLPRRRFWWGIFGQVLSPRGLLQGLGGKHPFCCLQEVLSTYDGKQRRSYPEVRSVDLLRDFYFFSVSERGCVLVPVFNVVGWAGQRRRLSSGRFAH